MSNANQERIQCLVVMALKAGSQLNQRTTIKGLSLFISFFSIVRNNFLINAGPKMLHLTVTRIPVPQPKSQKPDTAIQCDTTEQIPLFP